MSTNVGNKPMDFWFSMAVTLALMSAIGMGTAGCIGEVGDEDWGDDEENIAEAMQPVQYGGNDYLFVVTPRDWAAARSICALNGYKLVTINDANEENFLALEEYRRGSASDRWWIGYHDTGIEGSWIWDDGTIVNYSNWTPGEPNNQGNEDCAEDNYNTQGQWNDIGCGVARKFICERAGIPTTNNGSFSYSAANTNNGSTNTQNVSIYLYAGQTLTVGTCGVWGASFNGDTWLRLNNPSGAEVVSFDDGCGGVGTNFSFVASATGAHNLRAGCYSSQSCGGTVTWVIK